MKKSLILACTLALAAFPAAAMEVTNLDHVDHQVLFETSGGREVRTIQAGQTEYISGQPNGTISLLDAPHPKPSEGVVHADGILSGTVVGARTEGIPVDTDDVVAIWPNGEIGIQMHRRSGWLNH